MTASISNAHEKLQSALAELIEASTMAVCEDAVARRALREGQLIERRRIVALIRARADEMMPGVARLQLWNVIHELEAQP